MSEQPAGPPGLQVHETRVYYDPSTGKVLHVHQLVSAPGEPLSADHIAAEMKSFENTLRQRSADLDYLVLDIDDLSEFGDGVVVDVQQKKLVQRPDA